MGHHVVIGLGYGDEGKGSWVDHLVRLHGARTVVRFNGGAQALHHVVRPDGVVHGFSQFGSGTFVPDTRTLHSRFVLLEPLSLMKEALVLEKCGVHDPLGSLYISARAPLIPYANVLLNRIMEAARGQGRHGSCGLGIGLTQGDVERYGEQALYMGDLHSYALREKVHATFERIRDEAKQWKSLEGKQYYDELVTFDVDGYIDMLKYFTSRVRIISDAAVLQMIRDESCVFEGAQGVLLDQHHGFFPHATRSTTTALNARTLLEESGSGEDVCVHGLLRAYGTRHGAGPFVTEDTMSQIAPCHNRTGEWQGTFRHGGFDAVAARYAIDMAGGVDEFVITNLDRLDGMREHAICTGYRGMDTRWYDTQLDRLLGVSSYDDSRLRTEAVYRAYPETHVASGWISESDPRHEQYLEMIDQSVGMRVTAYSRTEGHQKQQRVTRALDLTQCA